MIAMSVSAHGAGMGMLKPGARKAPEGRIEKHDRGPEARATGQRAAAKAGFHAITSEKTGTELSSFKVGYSSVLSTVMDIAYASGYSGTSVGDAFYYCDYNTNSSGGITSVNWNCVDVDGKAVKFTLPQTTANAVCMDMTYDETTGKLYGMSAMADAVVTVDPATGSAEFAFETLPFYTLAADGGGQLYGILLEQDGGASLYSVNKFTGASIKVGDTGVKMLTSDGVSYYQTAAFSRADGKLYWLTPSQSGTDLYRVDVTTGRASMLCTLDALEALCMFDLPGEVLAGSPSRVTEATAEAEGMSVKVSFKAPSLTADGAGLTELSSIEIYRGGSVEAAHSIDNPAAGAACTWTDTEAKAGVNAYRIVAVNSVGESMPVYVTAFCGDDYPGAPAGVSVEATDGGYPVVTWTRPATGLNGISLEGVDLTYNVYRNAYGTEELIAERVEDISYTDVTLDLGRQAYPYYYVSAVSSAGEGPKSAPAGVHVGPAYGLPFEETFEQGTPATAPWTVQSLALGGTWELGMISTAPGTGPYVGQAMLIFRGFQGVAPGTEARIVTPELNFEGTQPELRFHFFHADFGEDMHFDDHVVVEVSVDGGEFEALPGADLYQYTANTRWTEYVFPLDKYAGNKKVCIGFHGISAGGMDLALDNIRVLDRLAGMEVTGEDSAPVEWYDLRGVRLDAPEPGICIRRQGGRAEKIMVE